MEEIVNLMNCGTQKAVKFVKELDTLRHRVTGFNHANELLGIILAEENSGHRDTLDRISYLKIQRKDIHQ